MPLSDLSLAVGEGVEGQSEVVVVGGWFLIVQNSEEVSGFLGGLEGLMPLSDLSLAVGEGVEGQSEVVVVGGWFLIVQNSEEVSGFLGGL